MNKEIIKALNDIADLLDLKSIPFKPAAYRKAAKSLENLKIDIAEIYFGKKVPKSAEGGPGPRPRSGLGGIKEIKGIGQSIALKIEEYIKKGRIKYLDELKEETAIRQIVAYFFKTKGVSLDELKYSAKKRKIIYSRFTKPAKQLLELSGSIEKAKSAIDKVADWAKSRKLDYAIETVFKKWLELDQLKPKEIVKKPFFQNNHMIFSQAKKKWYVIDKFGNWLEFAGKESEIEWRIES